MQCRSPAMLSLTFATFSCCSALSVWALLGAAVVALALRLCTAQHTRFVVARFLRPAKAWKLEQVRGGDATGDSD